MLGVGRGVLHGAGDDILHELGRVDASVERIVYDIIEARVLAAAGALRALLAKSAAGDLDIIH